MFNGLLGHRLVKLHPEVVLADGVLAESCGLESWGLLSGEVSGVA